MKTFNKQDIFSWSNAEEAEQYIGKFGYFSDGYFEDLKDWSYGKLTEICSDNHAIYDIFVSHEDNCEYAYGLFIPEDMVKAIKKEKKWRPFKTIEEFIKECNYISLGNSLTLRSKSDHSVELYVGYNGYSSKNGELLGINFGSGFIKPQQLFNLYEFFNNNGEWQPFGVEVEE